MTPLRIVRDGPPREPNAEWESTDSLRIPRHPFGEVAPIADASASPAYRYLLAEGRRQVETALEALHLPPKEVALYSRGLDRDGRPWRETDAVRRLREAIRSSLVVLLRGPVGTGKSSAACRVLIELCRLESCYTRGAAYHCDEIEAWPDREGRYLRAPDYARMADWEADELESVWAARCLVIDDLGEEEHLGEKATARLRLLLTRRDDEIAPGTRTIITTNLDRDALAKRYGLRVFDRLGELATWIRCDERVRPTKGQ